MNYFRTLSTVARKTVLLFQYPRLQPRRLGRVGGQESMNVQRRLTSSANLHHTIRPHCAGWEPPSPLLCSTPTSFSGYISHHSLEYYSYDRYLPVPWLHSELTESIMDRMAPAFTGCAMTYIDQSMRRPARHLLGVTPCRSYGHAYT